MFPYLRTIYRSFAIQLLLLHFRSNWLLFLLWGLLFFLMAGRIGHYLGLQYLFLDAEYLGEVGFVSFLIMGLAFGFFVMSWNLTTYLLTARYFGFLASLSRPFLKFCINNAILPLIVFGAYSVLLFQFNAPWAESGSAAKFMSSWLGLFAGLVLSLILYMIYFYLTNRDIYYYTGRRQKTTPPNLKVLQPFGRQLGHALDEVKRRENPYRIGGYLNNRLSYRPVRSVAHYDRHTLEEVFRQNHWNALFLQFASFAVLVLLGLLMDYPIFQFPAGASVLVLFSLVVFVIGAVSYWFSEWRLAILLIFLLGVNWVTSHKFFKRSNFAYGLDYKLPKQGYDTKRLLQLSREQEKVNQDSLATIQILDNWLARQADSNATMVLLCTSGGGLTAATWGVKVIQELERETDRKLLSQTVLMTGASGGMLGVGYLREAYRRYQVQEDTLDYLDPVLLDHVSTDLLNPLAFSIVSNDIFLPFSKVRIGDQVYYRDRAYSFEKRLNENTGFVLDHPLSFYRTPEQEAIIPMLFLTPSIVDDGRRLTISPQGVRYMMTPPAGRREDVNLVPDAVDLGGLVGEAQRDDLLFTTALRMNATYPYVLPFVHLPTEPTIRVMDAGYRDNYGILTAARFLQVFQDWIKTHTKQVLIIQISVFRGEEAQMGSRQEGIVESLLSPVGLAGNFANVQSLEQDNALGYIYDLLGPDQVKLIHFNYTPAEEGRLRTSVSFHLTAAEKAEILSAFRSSVHQENLAQASRLLTE